MAQQGFPPGRHSRGPYPGDAQYADETRNGDGTPYADELSRRGGDPYADEPARQGGDPYADELGGVGGDPYADETRDGVGAPYADELARRGGAPYPEEIPPQADVPPPGHGWRADRTMRPPRPDRPRRLDRQRPGEAWQQGDAFGPGRDTETDLPPWAYPGRPVMTTRRPAAPRRDAEGEGWRPADLDDRNAAQAPADAAGETRAGRRRGRAAAARLRKSRRRVYRWCGAAIAACVIAAGIIAIVTHHAPKPAPYVTSLQKGEFTSVPGACGSVTASVLNQFLPGAGRTTTNQLSSSTDSQCSFTVDAKPNFLVLEVQAQSYQPFAAAAADGSATGNAQDNYALIEQGLAHPPKKSPLPPAQISSVPGLGQHAFMSFQSAHVTGIVTDIVTVVVRERNVVITASLSGQESGHGFGPVPVSTLEAGARAAAASMLAKVMTQPTA